MIGNVTVSGVIWEIWSDGHAYSDHEDHWKRTKAGTWLPYTSCKDRSLRGYLDWIIFSDVSEELERVYLQYITKIITEE